MDKINHRYLSDQFSRLKGIKSVLEVGSRDVNGTSREFFEKAGVSYFGIDIQAGKGVDAVVDVTGSIEDIRSSLNGARYDLIVCMNVLEHIYEPIKALNNMLLLLKDNGYLMVVVPIVWDLHEYPYDFYRLNPDFFKKFGELNRLSIVNGSFLLATRDDERFYDDVENLPQIISNKYKNGFFKRLLKFAHKHFLPGLYDCWPHVSLNVIYQK